MSDTQQKIFLISISDVTRKRSAQFFFTIFFFLFSHISFAQHAPGIEWRVSTWSPRGLDLNFQTQAQSGEEWWYSHKNVYSAQGTHTSYVTVGYTSLVSTISTYSAAQDFFNEGPDSPCNPIDNVTYDYTTLAEGCSDRDYIGEHRTPPRGNLGLNALDGSMLYCKPKTIGALEEVIQDPAEPTAFYVVGVHVGVRPYRNKTDFIPYNRTATNPSNYFSLSAMGVSNYTNAVNHVYIAKCHLDGSVIWEGLYGYVDYQSSPFEAYKAASYGYDIIKNSNGHLVATGYARLNDLPNSPAYPFLIELDPANGNMINKAVLPASGSGLTPVTNSVTGYVRAGVGHSIEEIGNSGMYAVGVTYFFGNSTYHDSNNAFLWGVDQNLNASTVWTNNPIRLMGAGPISFSSIIWEVKYHKGLGQLMVPVVQDCSHCGTAGNNQGFGFIYRFNPDGSMASNGINPAPMGSVNAFDLRIGVEETTDGGFVAVSSTRPPTSDHTAPTQLELGYLASCAELDYTDWDTDALVVKYTSNGETQWKKIFDAGDDRKRVAPPGDLKRQECMYKITEAQDGGFVISGNSSGNFDDFYMAKLFDDCNAQKTYTWGPNYVLDIKSSTTWNASMNVIGKVMVHPGAVLSIEGQGTKICFADSKLTGIETNVTVISGGLLKFADGAIFSSIDTATCKNSKWDGIKYLDEIGDQNSLVIFPNPTSQNFSIIYNGNEEEEFTFTLTDLIGKTLRDGKLKSDLSLPVSTETLSAGVYFVSIFKEKKVIANKKLLVIRP